MPVTGRRIAPGMIARATRVALVVGTILVAVNQGEALLHEPLRVGMVVRVAVTFLVPFLVSLYAMLAAPGDRRHG